MFLPDNEAMKLVSLITSEPSDENIAAVVKTVRNRFPDWFSAAAQIELIGMAVEPIHAGITERLRKDLAG